MVWSPDLILYVCVAKGAAVLAEYASPSPADSEEEICAIARRCVERTPSHHSTFSHTVRRKSYTFLIDDLVAYFAISHEDLGAEESLRFLERVKGAFNAVVGDCGIDNEPASLCLQGMMFPLFSGLLHSKGKREFSGSPSPIREEEKARLLPSPPGFVLLTKKKRLFSGGGLTAAQSGGIDGHRSPSSGTDLPVNAAQKCGVNGAGNGARPGDEKQKVKQMWRMHVWVVLVLDVVVCAVLFTIWLGVCGGFKCIDG